MTRPLLAENADELLACEPMFRASCRRRSDESAHYDADVQGEEPQKDSLRDMLIEYHPEDSDPLLLAPHSIAGLDINSSFHSQTSCTMCESSPFAEESDLSMFSDSQSSVISLQSDHDLLHGEVLSDDELNADEPTPEPSQASFMTLRITYLLVTLVIMLADGLQGTLGKNKASFKERDVCLFCRFCD